MPAAKSLQSCPTLCNPIDGTPPGFPIPGILQARTLEWGAISSSNAWKWKVKVKSFSRVQLFTTSWTAAYQSPPSMGFSRQEYWSGLPLPSPLSFLDHIICKWSISFSDTLSIVSFVPSFKETCAISGVIIYHKNMSMLMLALTHTCMHVYVREKTRGEQRKRNNSIYIFIVHHALQLMSKDVDSCWQVKEKFLTNHEICIMQGNY